jgi:ribose transport system substrate-binding protein
VRYPCQELFTAKAQAEDVVKYCEAKNSCKVAILIGQLQFPFDHLRYKAYRSALDQDSNIKVIATDQGRWVT